jgi:hypothetical protein
VVGAIGLEPGQNRFHHICGDTLLTTRFRDEISHETKGKKRLPTPSQIRTVQISDLAGLHTDLLLHGQKWRRTMVSPYVVDGVHTLPTSNVSARALFHSEN